MVIFPAPDSGPSNCRIFYFVNDKIVSVILLKIVSEKSRSVVDFVAITVNNFHSQIII
jgi:hypothetical protein